MWRLQRVMLDRPGVLGHDRVRGEGYMWRRRRELEPLFWKEGGWGKDE